MPWTHHDWNEVVGYAHLDPIKDWPRKKSGNGHPAKKQDNMTLATKKRAMRMDLMALSPKWGRLRIRLDKTKKHMPVNPLLPNAACQPHRWAYKETNPVEEMEKANKKPSGLWSGVMQCKTCKVNLCLKCWKMYHKKHRLKPLVFDILGEDNNI